MNTRLREIQTKQSAEARTLDISVIQEKNKLVSSITLYMSGQD
jgi:hypothetical protein